MGNETIKGNALIAALEWRYATKKFDAKRKISAADWDVLERALVLSPSSYGLQPWKFEVVNDTTLRMRIKEAAWGQAQITDASHLVVFCAKKEMKAADVDRYISRIAEVRGVSVESLAQYRSGMQDFISQPPAGLVLSEWAARQAYISLGILLASAATMGIDACPMEGFQPDKVGEILGLSAQGYRAVVIATVGYRAADDNYANAKKVRFARQDVVHVR